MSEELLEVRDLHAAYGLSRVLFGVSLEVRRGECVCLLGRNGVGKSTTLRAIMGLTPPSSGTVRWQGKDVTGWAPNRAARSGVGFVPEDRRIFADLTVLFIEHDMNVVFRFASRIIVMVGGRILVEGAPEEISRDARVREVYLGKRQHHAAAA